VQSGSSNRFLVNKIKLSYLDAMGIQSWALRERPVAALLARSGEQSLSAREESDSTTEMGWSELKSCVQGCHECSLHLARTQTVFGAGDQSASWMLIGEAPGKDEDLQGKPFVGKAGRLLTEMLVAAELTREAVFITNIVKCRPPNNRDPEPKESDSCRGYLQRQIELVQPKILLALGRIAAQNLLGTELPLKELRGKIHYYGINKIPVVVVYHPAYLLRSLTKKRKAWDDIQLARKVLR
jgi:DNA polymerase